MNFEPANDPSKVITASHLDRDLAANEFNHAEWSKAQPIRITHVWTGQEAPASRHSEVRIIWTEAALLVRFVCRQAEPIIVNSNPQFDKKTIGLWDRDVCEIFIALDPNAPNRYFEFEAAPTGEWVDLAIYPGAAGRETDFEFQSGMVTATQASVGKLTIIMRIPWSESIRKPQPTDSWRVNLFRCIGTGNERYLAWQPTHTPEPNFHVPEAFGWLRFA